MASFTDLTTQYGSAEAIPHEQLYAWMEENRQSIINSFKDNPKAPSESVSGKEIRRRTKRDLYWAARWFTWCTNPETALVGKEISKNAILWEYYEPLLSVYIEKDDSKPIEEQSQIKNRMILWPRGGLKSTVDVVDTVQWILNFPAIRILFLTAEDKLAKGFVAETKGHFTAKPDDPSWMSLYFPEFCVSETYKEDAYQFTCPVWAAEKQERKEPTVLANSIASNLAGRHFEIIKPDDMVSELNSTNAVQCQKITERWDVSKKMLRPWGYIDFNGTRYSDADHYGTVLSKTSVGDIKITKGACWELRVNEEDGWKILVGKGIVIRPERARQLEAEQQKVNYKTAGPDGVDLLIPHIYPYPRLMKMWRDNEKAFESQINQNPRPSSTTIFDRALLMKATIPFSKIPVMGPTTQVWDFAFSEKKKRDYSTGSTVMWDNAGRMYVLDLVRKRLKPDELAEAFVFFARQWRPTVIGVENAGGSKFLEDSIKRAAAATGDAYVIDLCNRIDWFTVDTQADAKKLRMGQLQPMMQAGLCLLSERLPDLTTTVYEEFETCMQIARSSTIHDDIPDSIAHHLQYAPRIRTSIAKNEIQTYSRADAAFNLIFGNSTELYGGTMVGGEADPWGNPQFPGMAIPLVPAVESGLPAESYADGLPPVLGGGLIG